MDQKRHKLQGKFPYAHSQKYIAVHAASDDTGMLLLSQHNRLKIICEGNIYLSISKNFCIRVRIEMGMNYKCLN